jgi:hypothetical protein
MYTDLYGNHHETPEHNENYYADDYAERSRINKSSTNATANAPMPASTGPLSSGARVTPCPHISPGSAMHPGVPHSQIAPL